jgi:hypothetical protein
MIRSKIPKGELTNIPPTNAISTVINPNVPPIRYAVTIDPIVPKATRNQRKPPHPGTNVDKDFTISAVGSTPA